MNQAVAPFNQNYPYRDIDPQIEKRILTDFNNQIIHTTPEYQTNLNVNTPTNRVLTSMCSPKRLLFLLKYGITYYHKTKEREDGSIEQIDQKHILRYQQFFAAMIVRQRISEGVQSGIIWHTQGSGKTALSYHLSYVLTDYFSSVNKVAKYYFIVDRLDLLKQAKEEFEARGLIVKTANSRAELMEQFKTTNRRKARQANQKSLLSIFNALRKAMTKLSCLPTPQIFSACSSSTRRIEAISFVTTAPAAITAPSPMETPFVMTTLAPIQTLFPMCIGA